MGEVVSPEQMRHAIYKAYPGGDWATKVEAMSDKQVASVYLRLLNAKKLKG